MWSLSFHKLLCHTPRLWSRQLKALIGFEKKIYFSRERWAYLGGLCPIHLMCMEVAKCLNSRVSLVSVPIHPYSFSIVSFLFIVSQVRYNLFLKVEFILVAFFCGIRKSAVANSSAQRQKMKFDVGVDSSSVCSAQGKRIQILSLLSVFFFMWLFSL